MDDERLSMRERQVMDAVYRLRAATAGDVREQMPDPPSASAVRAVLATLAGKNLLRKQIKDGKTIWSATRRPQGVAKRATRRLLDTFFEGSLVRAVATHLSDPRVELTEADLDQLEKLIEESRRRARR